ncbi:MAG: LysM peptidoglycan-binding domain-containing protein [Litorilinea sp.]
MQPVQRAWRHMILTLCCLAGILGAILPTGAAQAQTDAETVQQLSGSAQEIVAAINQHRVNNGLNALAVNAHLNQAAQGQATDMMVNYNYSHRGSDGSTVKMRVARTGYAAEPWVSENWVSSSSVDGAMRWWMADYIHRVNILTPHWQEVGVGIASRPNTGEIIFVTVFSAGRSEAAVQASVVPAAQPAPAPAPAAAPRPAVDVPPGGMDYTIRSGDTLLGIAIRHNLDWRVVAAGNGLGEHSVLQIGQVVRLPGVEAAGLAQFDESATTGSTASTESDSTDSDFVQETAPAAPPIPTEPYTVQPGDTLFSIAARNGITWQELAGLNNFQESDFLQIGQAMVIPARPGTVQVTAAKTTTVAQPELAANETVGEPVAVAASVNLGAAPAATTEPTTPNTSGFVTAGYTTNPTPRENRSTNASSDATAASAPASQASVGNTVPVTVESLPVVESVPVVAASPAAPPSTAGAVHIVAAGDTIISIALRHAVDWQQLLDLNGLNDQSILQLGQTIRLP